MDCTHGNFCQSIDTGEVSSYLEYMSAVRLLTIGCALLGAAVSLYFTLATFHLVREDLIKGMPVCNIRGEKQRIVDTFYGRVFYVPNSVIGLVYYLALIVYGLLWWNTSGPVIDTGWLVVSFGVVIFSIYLFRSLIVKLRTLCKLCILTHILNLGIFITFVLKYYRR